MSEPKPLLKPVQPAVVDRRVWAEGRFIDDDWHPLADGDPVPAAGHVLLSLARWHRERVALVARGLLLGIRVETAELIDIDIQQLGDLAMVALPFPKFTDGRAYSAARRLREFGGYRGQIRATGDVLLDQIPLMLRAGFDAFEIQHAATLRALERGELPALTHIYQPAAEGSTRDWQSRRRVA